MTSSQLDLSGSVRHQLRTLRRQLVKARHELIEAEAQLAEEQAEINDFRVQFRLRVGVLVDRVQELQDDIDGFLKRLYRMRQAQAGRDIDPNDPFWQTAEESKNSELNPLPSLTVAEQSEVKRLYRDLARRFHPDFSMDDADRTFRTNVMASVNNAYANHDLEALRELSAEKYDQPSPQEQSESQIIENLKVQLMRCQRRMRQIDKERAGMQHQHIFQMYLRQCDTRARGRDYFRELATELKRKIDHMQGERDFLKAQFDELDLADDVGASA